MNETIKSLLDEELGKLESHDRDSLANSGIEIVIEDQLSGMGTRTLVPKLRGGRGEIDLDKPIDGANVQAVRRIVARLLRDKLGESL